MDTFDYIVVGAGSAGCAVAARLSEDTGLSPWWRPAVARYRPTCRKTSPRLGAGAIS